MGWSFEADKVEEYAYWTEAFTPSECKKIVEEAKKEDLNIATVNLDSSQKLQIRDSKVIFLPADKFSWVFKRISYLAIELNNQYFNFDLWGFGEGLQFTEYNAPSGKYNSHIDKMYNGFVRKLSIVVQLTDPTEYEGGELQLLNRGETDPLVMHKAQGFLCAFPSYTLHRVTTVTEGTRHSLVGWVTGKPFR